MRICTACALHIHELLTLSRPNPNLNPIQAHALTAIAHERTRLVAISKQDYERLIAERRARLHAEHPNPSSNPTPTPNPNPTPTLALTPTLPLALALALTLTQP